MKNINIEFFEFIGRKLRPVELRILIKKLFRIKRIKIILPAGRIYEIDPVSDLGLKLLKHKEYEPEMTKIIEGLLKEGDTFVDLGSNEGYFAILAGKLCGKKGKVFAIEPQKRLWNVIYNNSFLNELTNIHLLPYGIGPKRGTAIATLSLYKYRGIKFFKSPEFQNIFRLARKKMYGSQLTKIFAFDDIRNTFPDQIRLIKIDIEGFELEALKGALNTLKEHLFINILVEIHPEALHGMGQNESDIDDLLKKNGYKKENISYNLNLYSL